MEDYEIRNLLNDMVMSHIVIDEIGTMRIPINAMREFCKLIELGEDEHCIIGFELPHAEEGLFNFIYGFGSDKSAPIEITNIQYYDVDTGGSESIWGGDVLQGKVYRELHEGRALICGHLLIDEAGGLYIQATITDDIVADFRISLAPDNGGIQLCLSDFTESFHIWSDGDTIYVAKSAIIRLDSLPS